MDDYQIFLRFNSVDRVGFDSTSLFREDIWLEDYGVTQTILISEAVSLNRACTILAVH